MLEKGKQVPNWPVVDEEENVHALWDFRQKSHVLLINDAWPGEGIRTQKKKWDWLHLRFVRPTGQNPDIPAGALLIDRYGHLLNAYDRGGWTLEKVEEELVFYEAKHC